MTWSPAEFDWLMAEVKKRSAVDRAFRELALREPAAALRQISPKELPAELPLRFIESPGLHTVVLPDYVGQD